MCCQQRRNAGVVARREVGGEGAQRAPLAMPGDARWQHHSTPDTAKGQHPPHGADPPPAPRPTGWRTLLRFEEEVAPCHRLLFGAPADGPAWAPALHAALCAVRQQAEFVRTDGVARAAASRQHSRPPTPEGGAAPRPAKRCRSAS